MVYLHKSAEARSDIRRFLPSARSVIVTGAVYNTDDGRRPKAEGYVLPTRCAARTSLERGRRPVGNLETAVLSILAHSLSLPNAGRVHVQHLRGR